MKLKDLKYGQNFIFHEDDYSKGLLPDQAIVYMKTFSSITGRGDSIVNLDTGYIQSYSGDEKIIWLRQY